MTPATASRLYARAFPQSRPWSEAEFATLLCDPKVILCGDASAFVLARLAGDEAEIITLAADPTMRRQGLASAALRALEAQLRTRMAQTLFLEVASDNAPAIALYKGFGYEMAGSRPNYYRRPDGTTVAALVLRKALTAG